MTAAELGQIGRFRVIADECELALVEFVGSAVLDSRRKKPEGKFGRLARPVTRKENS